MVVFLCLIYLLFSNMYKNHISNLSCNHAGVIYMTIDKINHFPNSVPIKVLELNLKNQTVITNIIDGEIKCIKGNLYFTDTSVVVDGLYQTNGKISVKGSNIQINSIAHTNGADTYKLDCVDSYVLVDNSKTAFNNTSDFDDADSIYNCAIANSVKVEHHGNYFTSWFYGS